MTYLNAVKYITSHSEGMPSPERMRMLCHYLGEPQKQLKFVHVAGGSGKTSCSIMLSVILSESGYKPGRLSTTTIKEPREYISIANLPLSHKEFASYIETVISASIQMKSDIEAQKKRIDTQSAESIDDSVFAKPKITKNLMDGRISPDPVSSEIICAAAFLAFIKNNCNIVILECGESRTDPTGIIDPPLVAVICGNHLSEGQLRTSIGVIRRGTREVVSSAPAGESFNAIVDACSRIGARLTVPAHGELRQIRIGLSSRTFEYRSKIYNIPFCAEYQLKNALLTIEAVYALRRTGIALHGTNVEKGISKARVPLKFELYSASPTVIIDCPSTVYDATAFCDSLASVKHLIGHTLKVVAEVSTCSVSISQLEKLGFTIESIFEPQNSHDDKKVAEDIIKMPPDQTMLIIGMPAFCDRIKDSITRYMLYK